MKNQQRKLPDGTLTQDPDQYGDAWCTLGDQVATALGPEWYMAACNPGLVLRSKVSNTQDLRLSVSVALRIIELHTNCRGVD